MIFIYHNILHNDLYIQLNNFKIVTKSHNNFMACSRYIPSSTKNIDLDFYCY
jgi:hypothetical protein